MAFPKLAFCTYRFCGLPQGYDERILRGLVPLQLDEKVLLSSLAPDYHISDSTSHIGTVI